MSALLPWALEVAAHAVDEGGDYPAVIARERPMIGLYTDDHMPTQVAAREGLPAGTGLFVAGIIPGSAAERMGIRGGDVILSFNGQPVSSYGDIVAARDQYSAGDVADIQFSRGASVVTASAPLGSWTSSPVSGSRRSPKAPEVDQAMVDRLRDLVESVEQAYPELAEPVVKERDRLRALSDRLASGAWRFSGEVLAPALLGASDADLPALEVSANGSSTDLGGWRLEWRSVAP